MALNVKDNAQLISATSTHSNGEFIGIVNLLINELKEAQNAKLELVFLKLKGLEEQITKLSQENSELKEKLQIKENSQQSQQPYARTTSNGKVVGQENYQKQYIKNIQEETTKQRGMKSHNLIITCEKFNSDPKKYIESIFLEKYNRKPNIVAVQELKSKTTEEKLSKFLVIFHSVLEANIIYKDRVQALRNTRIYVQEDLTREESYLFYKARQLKKRKIISQTWTENGTVYIKENTDSHPQIMSENSPLVHENINSPINPQTTQDPSTIDIPKEINNKHENETNPIHQAIGKTELSTKKSEISSSGSTISITKESNQEQIIDKRKTRRKKKNRTKSE